jgi:hypothetical protein
LASLTAGKGYQLAGEANNSERAQVNTLTLGSNLINGDTIKLKFDDGTQSLEVSYTVVGSNTTEIRDGLIDTINEKMWKDLGAGRFVEAATKYDAATQQLNGNQILLNGTVNGKSYTITSSHNQIENSNKLSLTAGTGAFKDADTSQDLELSSITSNQAATNQTNQTFIIKEDNKRYANNSVVSITSGLLQQSNNHLLGANIFLTSDSEIIDASGNKATAPQEIRTNHVLYVETKAASTDSYTGKYYTYKGNTTSLTGAQLRSLLDTTPDSSQWQETNGNNYQLVAIGGTSDNYVLAGSSNGPSLLGATVATKSKATLQVQCDAPYATFDPSKAVTNENDTLHLNGLGLETGEIITPERISSLFIPGRELQPAIYKTVLKQWSDYDSLPVGETKESIEAKPNVTVVTRDRQVLNPDYDPTQEYIPRENRPEWNIIGLLGQVPIKAGETVNPRWILMKAISSNTNLYLIR